MTHQIITARQLAPVPWANGSGTTRVIAAQEPGSAGSGPVGAGATHDAPGPGFLWRLSLADLVDDSAFSALPGVDRVFTLVTAGPVELHVGSRAHTLTRGRQAAFAGETSVRAVLGEAGPQQAVNLMVDRSVARGEVRVEGLEGGWSDLDAADVAIFLLSGAVALPDGGRVSQGQVLRPHGRAQIRPASAAETPLVARVRVTVDEGVR